MIAFLIKGAAPRLCPPGYWNPGFVGEEPGRSLLLAQRSRSAEGFDR